MEIIDPWCLSFFSTYDSHKIVHMMCQPFDSSSSKDIHGLLCHCKFVARNKDDVG